MTNQPEPKVIAAKLRSIGVSESYANELANRKRTPSGKLAAKIEAELKIPASAWFNDAPIRQTA